jgi:hypothetical protein
MTGDLVRLLTPSWVNHSQRSNHVNWDLNWILYMFIRTVFWLDGQDSDRAHHATPTADIGSDRDLTGQCAVEESFFSLK